MSAISGINRPADMVQKKWGNLTQHARRRSSEQRRENSKTGGGPAKKILTELDENILAVIPPESITGISDGIDTSENKANIKLDSCREEMLKKSIETSPAHVKSEKKERTEKKDLTDEYLRSRIDLVNLQRKKELLKIEYLQLKINQTVQNSRFIPSAGSLRGFPPFGNSWSGLTGCAGTSMRFTTSPSRSS